MTKTNKIGVVGALDIPFLHRYTDAYRDGAKAVNSNVEVEQALAMNASGADIIFTATAGGVMKAPRNKNPFGDVRAKAKTG